MANVPVATSMVLDKSLEPRTLVIGVVVNGVSKAYPLDAVLRQSPIIDDPGGIPIFLVVGDDKRSVRAFERTIDNGNLEFFVKPDSSPLVIVDAETGSEWDFTGKSISGPLSGRQLKKVAILTTTGSTGRPTIPTRSFMTWAGVKGLMSASFAKYSSSGSLRARG